MVETLCLMNEQSLIMYGTYAVYSMESSSNNMKLNAHAFIEAKRIARFQFLQPLFVSEKSILKWYNNKCSSSTNNAFYVQWVLHFIDLDRRLGRQTDVVCVCEWA